MEEEEYRRDKNENSESDLLDDDNDASYESLF